MEACETTSDNTSNNSNRNAYDAGMAKIKPEYLVLNSTRTINLDFVSKDDKDKLEFENNNGNNEQPPNKRIKLTGQNKRRPHEAKIRKEDKLCHFLVKEEKCPYGDKCTFCHDVDKFLKEMKPKDIGDNCHLYETFGKCPYGIACRFAKCHLTEDHKNMVREDDWVDLKSSKFVSNTLSKDLQFLLRKKKYNFSKTDEVLKKFNINNKMIGAPVKTKMDSDSVDINKLTSRELKKIDWKNKLVLAPLTTVGNLPFRRICKKFGVDITCGEMAMCINLLQGENAEWALLRRHHTEDIFGIQLCGAHPDSMTKCAQLIVENANVDFIDVNVGCPIDLVYKKGAGCGLMERRNKLRDIVLGMKSVMDIPLSIKLRTGVYEKKTNAHELAPLLREWGVDVIAVHGRSREQRYTKLANWDYIDQCAKAAAPLPLFGVGDMFSYSDLSYQLENTAVSGAMFARGALVKPWVFTEVKEQRHWDISSKERLDILQEFVNFGLEHWGSDWDGVQKTRRFLLEWLSFLYRYIPVGILERVPQKINERPPIFHGRDDLETLMASPNCSDWIKISEMFLGKVSDDFIFLPKHKANSYQETSQ